MKKTPFWLSVTAVLLLGLAVTPVMSAEAPSDVTAMQAILTSGLGQALETSRAALAADADGAELNRLSLGSEVETLVTEVMRLREARIELLELVAKADSAAITKFGGAYHEALEELNQKLVELDMPEEIIQLVDQVVHESE